jgi:cell wall-associated NlpC family hydrolase
VPVLNFLVLLLCLTTAAGAAAAEGRFAQALMNTPVLNTPDFKAVFGGKDGKTLQTDRCGQPRGVEFIAPINTLFKIEEPLRSNGAIIYRVTTNDYPCPKAGCFIDGRSVRLSGFSPADRPKVLPSEKSILTAIEARQGTRYVWGGNVAGGVRELTEWYPPKGQVDSGLWQLAGLDCSGLLYEATGGFTPRNTSELAAYGTAVTIAGRSIREITASVHPLDLIVWPGHVMIILDRERVIESRLVCNRPAEGVRIRPLKEALQTVMKTRTAVDTPAKGAKEFGIRRWYDRAAELARKLSSNP